MRLKGQAMGWLENKLPPPLVFFVIAAAMWFGSAYGPSLTLPSPFQWGGIAALLLVGLVGPMAILQFVRAKTTIDPIKIENAKNLVTSGAFSVTRNPMYLSMAALLSAWALYLGALWVWAGPAVFVAFITLFQILPEERVMAQKFGAQFDAYRARVRRWI
jgi:protein-S-isoprenylcysteine O-methyltransferase Ste14